MERICTDRDPIPQYNPMYVDGRLMTCPLSVSRYFTSGDSIFLAWKSTHQIEINIDYNTIYYPVVAVPIFQKEIVALNVEHTAMVSLDNTGKIIKFFCGSSWRNRFRKGIRYFSGSR